jgi:hypothetical protein
MLRWRSHFLVTLLWAFPIGSLVAAPASPSKPGSAGAKTPAKTGTTASQSAAPTQTGTDSTTAAPKESAPSAEPLSQEAMNSASKEDAISVPNPGELMAALNKQGKPNWQSQYRQPIPTVFSSRPQIALNLGGLIADGYIAIEAEDSQQVKNIGKDIISLAKALNVSENVLRRGKSIEEFADNNEWNTLKEELEATQNEVKLTMNEQQDRDLVVLVTLGGWIRGTEVVSGWIAENYTPETAKLLRQPAVVEILRAGLNNLPEKLKNDPLIQSVNTDLAKIQSMVSFPKETAPSLEEVKALKAASSELVKLIITKK